MEKAIFSMEGFRFDEIQMDLRNVTDSLKIAIKPSGVFDSADGKYELTFEFEATSDEDNPIIKIMCRAGFLFKTIRNVDDIPQYFYSNCIAIIFPYIRSFISSVTLQAGIKPITLPIMNLISLQEELKNNTEVR